MKNISIILINYNTAKFTLDCITSIYKNTTKTIDFEIIVVDNNSKDEDYKILCDGLKKNPDVVLHSSPINTGFVNDFRPMRIKVEPFGKDWESRKNLTDVVEIFLHDQQIH